MIAARRRLFVTPLLLLLALLPAVASAHAALVRSDPTTNAALGPGLKQITLTFTEPVEPSLSGIKVLSSAGEEFAEGGLMLAGDGLQLSVAVRELPPDVYSVVWTSYSTVDGHSLTGAYPFTVLNPDGTAPSGNAFASADAGTYAPPLSGTIARWLLVLASGLLLGAGVLTVLGGRLPPRYWRVAGVALVVAGVVVFVEFLVRERSAGVGTLLQTRQGRLIAGQAAAAIVAGGLGLLVAWGHTRRGEAGGVPFSWGIGAANQVVSVIPLAIALVSHSATGSGHGWATLTLSIHIWLALAWPGALVGLVVLRRHGGFDRTLLLRFSTFALASAAVVLIAGVLVAATQVPGRDGLSDTDYGRALVLKVALAIGALAFAGLNTLLLHRRLDDRLAGRGLISEAIMLVLVLMVAGRLSQLPPPATAGASGSTGGVGFERTTGVGDLTGTLAVAPNVVGSNRFVVALTRADGSEVGEVLRVRLRFTPSDPALGTSEVIANPAGGNRFQVEGAFFSSAGQWKVGIDVRRRGVDDVAGEYSLQVEPPRQAATGSTWAWPVKQFSLLQYAAMLVGTAGVALLLGQLRGGFRPELRRSKYVYAGLALGVWGFVFPFFAREERAIDYLTLRNPVQASDASVARGRELYLQNCAGCHGQEGRGDGPQAAVLNPKPFDLQVHGPLHGDGQIFGWITDGIPRTAMPGWGKTTSEEDRWNLVNFLRTLTK